MDVSAPTARTEAAVGSSCVIALATKWRGVDRRGCLLDEVCSSLCRLQKIMWTLPIHGTLGRGPLLTAPAALRLVFKFSREAGATLPILRQGGDKSAETVVLEVEII